ncbi:hypothetical protein GCM10009547_24030 [Sporichthya brevicatena]|uniref:PPM-type phosphatase domain-containing protein n=1 Tax=Sporichthya brevicatena TaxID=171442 RepID=A0ABP3RY09_9ACTN
MSGSEHLSALETAELLAELTASNARFAQIARTLQRSLLPPVLPAPEGLDLCGVFHPSREGQDVSGDFYDVFPAGRSDLMLALGDVCGKGAEAAAITAIARHTIRAVAPDLRSPAHILRRLNDTMLGHDIDERFCTVVLARVPASSTESGSRSARPAICSRSWSAPTAASSASDCRGRCSGCSPTSACSRRPCNCGAAT